MALTIEEYEKLLPHADIEHDGVKMTFLTPTTMTLWRPVHPNEGAVDAGVDR